MLRRTSVLTASFLMLTAISSCAVGDGGKQSPPQAAPSTGKVNPELAVENPKDLKAIKDACQLLTPEQLTSLQVKGSPTQGESEFKEPSCDYRGSSFRASISLNTNAGGMTAAHERKGNFDNFEATEVSGYPAVKVNFSDNLCNLAVGVSESQSLHVYYLAISGGTPEMQDTCGYASKIATEAIKNIPRA